MHSSVMNSGLVNTEESKLECQNAVVGGGGSLNYSPKSCTHATPKTATPKSVTSATKQLSQETCLFTFLQSTDEGCSLGQGMRTTEYKPFICI